MPELTPCIEWTKGRHESGYGITYRNGRQERAHRVAWENEHGPIPDGLQVLHKCDNRPCVNVEHLFLGTNADNRADMMAKGRYVLGRRHHGESHRNAKLTWDQVAEIRRLHATGTCTHRRLASLFGVSHILIGGIVRGSRWKVDQ